jgi:pSer/pThr/pTyr-binding forkhead associated (FHA) protein
MTPKLIEPGAQARETREIPIRGQEFVIGRGNDCDLRLRDPNISRHHCMIRVRPLEVTLVELGSSNGSFVNGNRVIGQAILQSGDEIRMGEYRFVVDLGDGYVPLPVKPPDVDAMAKTLKPNEFLGPREET